MKKLFIPIFVAVSALLMTENIQAREVKGTVKCEGKALEGVIVTDGTSFTKTTSKGKFSFEINDEADFVYVVTPSGYTAQAEAGSPCFYIPADAKDFNFNLVKTSDSKDYTIIAIADPQTKTMKHFHQFCGEPLEDLVAQCHVSASKATTVGLVLGDICWDSIPILNEFKDKISLTGIPFYSVIGNHDHKRELKGDHNTSGPYRDVFGPENYAFCIGGDMVIVLDNTIYDTNKKYVEGFTDAQIEWVRGLLEVAPEGSRFYLAAHCPIYRWFKKGSFTENGEKMIALFGDRDLTFLTGHTHINNNYEFSPNVREFNVAALCGSWWDTEHCNDGTPRGYRIIDKTDSGRDSYYKSVGHDRYFQYEIFTLGQSAIYPDCVVANVWDYDPAWTIEWFEDGTPRGAMTQQIDYSPIYVDEVLNAFERDFSKVPPFKLPRQNTHYFVAKPSPETSIVTILIRDRKGHEWARNINLRGGQAGPVIPQDVKDFIDNQKSNIPNSAIWKAKRF